MGQVDDGVQRTVNASRKLGGSIPSWPTMLRATPVVVTATPNPITPWRQQVMKACKTVRFRNRVAQLPPMVESWVQRSEHL